MKTALVDHRFTEVVRIIEKLLVDGYPKFIVLRTGDERDCEIAPRVKMAFCRCPPGEFLMGSPETEEEWCDDEKQKRVTLTKGFWIAKTQVTQR